MGVGNQKFYLEWGGDFLPGERNKEYEIRTKMEHEQWLQLKMLFLLGYNLKMLLSACLCVVGGGTPPILFPPVGKTLQYRDKIWSQNPTKLQ